MKSLTAIVLALTLGGCASITTEGILRDYEVRKRVHTPQTAAEYLERAAFLLEEKGNYSLALKDLECASKLSPDVQLQDRIYFLGAKCYLNKVEEANLFNDYDKLFQIRSNCESARQSAEAIVSQNEETQKLARQIKATCSLMRIVYPKY